MDDRQLKLQAWLTEYFVQVGAPHQGEWEFEPVSGDASFRRYFRFKHVGRSWMAADAPPDKEKGTAAFVDISSRLVAADVCAPKVYASDIEQGFMLLDDMGNTSFRELISQPEDAGFIPQFFPVLQQLSDEVSCVGLADYSGDLLEAEMDEFHLWYSDYHVKMPFSDEEHELWQQLKSVVLEQLAVQPQVFVHRDFISSNLMLTVDKKIAAIDFQDAVVGPLCYDFASLVWDRYISWPRPVLEAWMEQVRILIAPQMDSITWRRWCDWTGLQRNLKIVGRFARLCYRDDKPSYLELLPRFKGFVLDTLIEYPELAPYRAIIESRL